MKKLLNISALLFLFLAFAHAQVDRTKAPEPGPAPKIQIGEYQKFELPNGLKVFVVEDHRLPKVSFSISFIFDPPLEGSNTGIGSMTGELIGTGTKNRTKDQINQEIDFIGGRLDASASGIYASSLKKHTEKLLEILSDVTQNSIFKPEELEKSKKQSLSGLAASKDDPSFIAGNVSTALIFGKNHPYGEFETEASIKTFTPEMCTKYYETYFKPNIAYLSIVGDITLAEAKKLTEKYFSSWKRGEVKNPVYEKPQPPTTTKVALVDRPQSVQSVINICYPIERTLASPDYIPSNVTNTVLGGGVFRLFNNLREKHAFTYGAYSRLTARPLISNFSANTNVRNEVTDSAITEILYEMKRMRDEPVPAEELSMVKNYLTGNFALSLENPQTIASFAVNTERYKLPKDFYANYLKKIEAVTSADVQQMAKKYFLPNQSIILVVGKASEIAEKLKKFSSDGKIEYYDIEANRYEPEKKTAISSDITAKSVLMKYIEAAGGENNISKIKDLKVKGTMGIQGMKLNLDMIHKLPGKFLMEIQMNGQTVQKIVLNGNTGRSSGMQGNKDLTGEELEKMKLQADPFPENKYETLGYQTVLKGIEKVNGSDAYVIEITSPSKNVTTEYYSVSTSLKVRTVSVEGNATQTSDILEYSEVNGVKYPKKIQNQVGPQNIEIAIDTVEVNTSVKDEVFN